MTALPSQRLPLGHLLFARYAFPPNELGYCGPRDATVLLRNDSPDDIAAHAREFDGTWPYLTAIADAAGIDDPLDAEVMAGYWVGGPLLERVDPGSLVSSLRTAFTGQVTGLLAELAYPDGALAHHSFHVFVVYPWVRFLGRDATTALEVMQNCRIRWGTVQSVADEFADILSRPLVFQNNVIALGDPRIERVRWSKDGVSLTSAPRPGDTVSAHWHWLCDTLNGGQTAALQTATQTTLDLVNTIRKRS
jgi:hypothetical protein